MTRIIKFNHTLRAFPLFVFVAGLVVAMWFTGTAVAQTGNPYACPTHPQIPTATRNGTCVQALQWLLNSKIPTPALEENGDFDTATEDKLTLYQKGAGLKCTDGIAGPETWNSLIPGLNQTGGCAGGGATTTPSATNTTTGGVSAGCSKIEQNFTEFGGGTPGPLANNCYTPGEGVNKVIKIAFTLVGILTVLFIVIGGFRYMTSAGDEKRAGSGKKTIQWALIGLVLVLFAYAIVTISTRLATTSQLF